MIIYFDKKTGDIVGTVEGRIHDESHLGMWIGDKEQNDRIIVQYKAVKWYDKDGNEVPQNALDSEGHSVVYAADFEPQTEQKDLFVELDKKPAKIYKYKVDPKTKLLIAK